jgi:hypothetical protein
MEKNMGEPMGHCGQRWKMYGENCHFLGSEVPRLSIVINGEMY